MSADLSSRRCRMSPKCSFLLMEKLRFVSPMYEKSQHGKEFDILLIVAQYGPLNLRDIARFLPMVLYCFKYGFHIVVRQTALYFFCPSGVVGHNGEAFELLFCAV